MGIINKGVLTETGSIIRKSMVINHVGIIIVAILCVLLDTVYTSISLLVETCSLTIYLRPLSVR